MENSGYPWRPEDLKLFPDVAPCLKTLSAMGFLLLVVTNQSGVARGFFNLSDVYNFHRHLQGRLLASGGRGFDSFYICPHLNRDGGGFAPGFAVDCNCRKPKPGLVEMAIREFGLDVRQSVLIGDRDSDVESGLKAGIGANYQLLRPGSDEKPHAGAKGVGPDLAVLTTRILSDAGQKLAK